MTEISSQAALDFLERFHPGGPWVLSAKVDHMLTTATFGPDTAEDCRRWIDRYNGRHNLYFLINPPSSHLTRKAERTDIKSLSWIHIDVDPREREDVPTDQQRIAHLLSDRLPAGVPPPTCVIASGGGYWGFWRLEEPLPIEGDLEKAELAKLYSLQLERLFGADSCHNIDRIARLPGSLNIPDAKKRAKGRVETVAEVVEFNDLVYPLSSFSRATPVQTPTEAGFSAAEPTVEVSGNVRKIADLGELKEYGLPDRIHLIVAQGSGAQGAPGMGPKEGDNSRSAWMFDGVCGLARAKVPDEIIYSLLMDPGWGISESILDKGSNANRHALRQIARAKQFTINPVLVELNDKFAVIGNMGGKCRIVEEIVDLAMDRTRLTRQSFEDFMNRYRNKKVEIQTDKGPMLVPRGKWWVDHPERRQYDTIAFAPNKSAPGVYNLWKGFTCEARPGDCSLLLSHVLENICSGNQDYYEYFMNWMARSVQYPDSPGEVAVVLRGDQGVGKSFTVKAFGSLFGRHFLTVADPKHLVGNFNAHLRDTVLLFGEEAFFAGDKRHESILKMLITDEHLVIEGKGVDAEIARNCVHLIMASNNDWVIPAGKHERRFFVLDVSNRRRQEGSYFRAIKEQMDKGGREALLHHLLHERRAAPGDFTVQAVPRTSALRQQQDFSLSPEESWWFEKLVAGTLLGDSPWAAEVGKDELFDDYIEHARRLNLQRRVNPTVLGIFLKRVLPPLTKTQKMHKRRFITSEGHADYRSVRCYVYQMPSLGVARAHWAEKYGAQEWPEDAQEELPVTEPPARSVF